MSKKTKFALKSTLVLSLVFEIAPIVGLIIINKTFPNPVAYLFAIAQSFLIFLALSAGYEEGFKECLKEKLIFTQKLVLILGTSFTHLNYIVLTILA